MYALCIITIAHNWGFKKIPELKLLVGVRQEEKESKIPWVTLGYTYPQICYYYYCYHYYYLTFSQWENSIDKAVWLSG